MHYLHKSRLPIRMKQKSLCYFHLEIDYFSNKMNKKGYKSFQLIASEKQNNLETAAEEVA